MSLDTWGVVSVTGVWGCSHSGGMIAVRFFQINVGWHKMNVNHGSDNDSKAALLFDPGMLFEKPTEKGSACHSSSPSTL